MSLTYSFALDAAETVRATRHVQRRQRFAWIAWAVWPMLVGLAALYLATGVPWQELWLLALVALFLGTSRIFTPWFRQRRLRRAYAGTPSLREPQVYHFSDAGLTITGGPATTTLTWPAIVEAAETGEFFLLFYNKQCAYYVPKRVVGDPEEQRRLREFLSVQLGSRAQLLKRA